MTAKLLIVEDEIMIATQLSYSLSAVGYEVLEPVVSGEEAVRVCRQFAPDVILMDIGLAGKINGIEAAQVIRNFSRAPIIFITGYADDALDLLLPSIQPALYLSKPVKSVQVQQAISWMLGRAN